MTDRLARSGASASQADWRDRPAATVAWSDNCPTLVALNPHARAIGLRVGMRLADAHALVPELVTAEVEPDADRALVEQIASWCDRYTPWVAVDPLGAALAAPDARTICGAGGYGGDAGLLLDVTGCSHLYGQGETGERALMADLVQRLSRHDFTCRAAMADTAGAATDSGCPAVMPQTCGGRLASASPGAMSVSCADVTTATDLERLR